MIPAVEIVASVCLFWSLVVLVVQSLGVTALFRKYGRRPLPSVPSTRKDAPVVTIIRPVKGLEPQLYECIASTFRQDYPRDKLSIRLCVEDRSDPAYPVLQQLVAEFPGFDAKVLLESDDDVLQSSAASMGPNPKIRNISRAYREARGDIIWIVDCNVWVGRGAMGRMVDKLLGHGQTRPYKFVHHLPIVTDLVDFTNPDAGGLFSQVMTQGGGRLDEMFMATTHAKFYGAINLVGVAPCIVGKSNMFRKSHLNHATSPANPLIKTDDRHPGVDYFSHNICEDHLIGDILWRTQLGDFANHGICWGDLVVQPMSGMSLSAYMARRVRWLRARKYTVLAATLVEPTVEAFLCCAYFAFGVTTLPWTGLPQTWTATLVTWLIAVSGWMSVDWATVRCLHSGRSMEVDPQAPAFTRGTTQRPFVEWLPAWLGREFLAIPIWVSGVLLGSKVKWRGSEFYVRFDTSVVDLKRRDGTNGKVKGG